jgi:iron complex outermembrane recepter protein
MNYERRSNDLAGACDQVGPQSKALLAAGSPIKRRLLSRPSPVWATAFAVSTGTLAIPSEAANADPQPVAEEAPLETIMVQAQRRAENLQEVPIAVTAISAEDLANSNVTNSRELGVVAPSFVASDVGGWATPTLRGIGQPATGPGIESPVAIYVDGVYQAAIITGNIDFNNVAAVEVVAGPQGTLFGRNATAGIVQIRTKDPSHELSGNASLGYGNYQTATASAYVTGGITDTIAANLSVNLRYQDHGYGVNLATGSEVDYTNFVAFRSTWLFTPSDELKIRLSGDFGRMTTAPSNPLVPGSVPIGSTTPVFLPPHVSEGPINPINAVKQGGLTATINYDLGPLTLNSISSYRDSRSNQDGEGSTIADPNWALHLAIYEPHTQISQELQLASAPGASINWTVGAFYFYERSGWNPALAGGNFYVGGTPFSALGFDVDNKTQSGALYAQATKEILPSTDLTLGARYTKEKRDFSSNSFAQDPVIGPTGYTFLSKSKTFNAPTWRVALDHKFSDTLMGYISYNRGFKSGEFDPLTGNLVSPEKLDAYELGLKSQLLDDHLRINTSAFWYKYRNMQVSSFVEGFPALENGAASRLYGLDLDAQARVTTHLTVNLGLALLHSEFTEFPSAVSAYPNPNTDSTIPPGGDLYVPGGVDAAGKQLAKAPHAVVNLGGTYRVPMGTHSLSFTALDSYNSGWFAEPDNRLRQGAYNLLNANVAWETAHGFTLTFWGSNLTNKAVASFLASNSFGDDTQYQDPRTYGVTIKQEF